MNSRTLFKLGAAGGILYPVLHMVAQSLIQVGGMEPSFTAPADETLAFFATRDPTLFNLGGYLSTVTIIPYIWFLGVLWSALRRAEGEPGWLSLSAFGSGLIVPATWLIGGWGLAMFRLEDGLDPQIAQLLFDQGNFGFASSWVFLASMVLATGVITIRATLFPRWYGWVSVLIAIGLLVGRAGWTTQAAFGPYVLYWVWLIVTSILLIRRADTLQSTN